MEEKEISIEEFMRKFREMPAEPVLSDEQWAQVTMEKTKEPEAEVHNTLVGSGHDANEGPNTMTATLTLTIEQAETLDDMLCAEISMAYDDGCDEVADEWIEIQEALREQTGVHHGD